jgi:DNA-binding response OmpR family regulator
MYMGSHVVLVVDDDSAQRRFFRRLFESGGLTVQSAASGAEALEMTAGSDRLPGLILSDIAMPEMDGVSLLRRLRENSATAAIPAILMTALPLPIGLMEAAVESLRIGPMHIKGSPNDVLLERVLANLNKGPRAGGVVIDALKRTIWIDDYQLPELPARRFQLLCALLNHPLGMSREALLNQVWDGKDDINIVGVTVLRLRGDLKSVAFLSIETVGDGYLLRIGPRRKPGGLP